MPKAWKQEDHSGEADSGVKQQGLFLMNFPKKLAKIQWNIGKLF